MIRKQAPHRYITVTSGSPIKPTRQEWTREHDHLVWCLPCRTWRSIPHRDDHAAAVAAGGFVPGVTSQPGSPFRHWRGPR